MKIFYQSCLFLVSLISFNSNSQIEINADLYKKKSDSLLQLKNNITPKREIEGSTEIFIGANCSKGFRLLKENGDLYGSPLGKRADEKSLTTWSYFLGFRNYLSKHLALEGGISFLKNGESYSYKTADSSFNYQTTYSYIAMPIRLYYSIGNEIKLLIGGGLIPQMFNQYRQEQQWTNQQNTKGSSSIKTKNDFNTFVVSACINTSLQLGYSKYWSIFITPEYRWQLNSTYLKIDNYIHKARVFGLNVGFAYQL